jgi:hypothetical protein
LHLKIHCFVSHFIKSHFIKMKLETFSAIPFLALLLFHSKMAESFSVTSTADRMSSKTALSVSFSSRHADEAPEGTHPNRLAEFIDLEPIEESSIRQERMKKDQEIDRQFVTYGDALWRLRKEMNELSRKLVDAINDGFLEEEKMIRAQLREVEQQDPELVYALELKKLHKAKSEGRLDDTERHGANAMGARSCLPAYNLEGLWVGK